MTFKFTSSGRLRYTVKQRINRKVITRYFSTAQAARQYRAELDTEKQRVKTIIDSEMELENRLNQLEELVDQITDQHMVCQGFIRRKGGWIGVKAIRTPLTHDEKLHIRRIKAKATKMVLRNT
jgi:acetolactate synthase regulatory subunit